MTNRFHVYALVGSTETLKGKFKTRAEAETCRVWLSRQGIRSALYGYPATR